MYFDWVEEALCKTVPEETVEKLFFPSKSYSKQSIRHEMRSICAQCPVQPQCLQHSQSRIDEFYIYGPWGGLTEREIRILRHLELPRLSMNLEKINLDSQSLARKLASRTYRDSKDHSKYQAEIQPFIERFLIWRSQSTKPKHTELVS